MCIKRISKYVVVLMLLVFVVTACAPSADDPPPPANGDGSTPPADDPIRVALCTSGPITDGGWNTLAYEGLLSIRDSYDNVEIGYTENVAQDDQAGVIRDYARAGFDVIIGHGYEWEDALVTIAEDFPDTWFAQTGGEAGGKLPNVTSGVFTTGEAGYIAGLVASELTKSGVTGFVGAMEIPTIAEEVLTARSTAEKLYGYSMVVGYTGSWVDVSAGYEAAVAQIEEGADVLIGIGNAADGGAIQASQERGGDVWYIGWVGDLNELAPDIIATSLVQDIGAVMRDFFQQYLDGAEGTAGAYGVSTGHMYFGTWADGVPQEIIDLALEEQRKVVDGEMTRLDIFDMLDIEPIMSYD